MNFLTPENLASLVRDEEMEGCNSGPVRSIHSHLRAAQKEMWGIAHQFHDPECAYCGGTGEYWLCDIQNELAEDFSESGDIQKCDCVHPLFHSFIARVKAESKALKEAKVN